MATSLTHLEGRHVGRSDKYTATDFGTRVGGKDTLVLGYYCMLY